VVADSADVPVANAKATTSCVPGQCLWQTQEWLESPHAYHDAAAQWRNATHQHADDRKPPRGAPTFYTGGTNGYGHACISLGDGKIRSTDCPSSGNVGNTDIGWPERAWGLKYAGWTEDIGGVDIPWLRNVARGVRREGGQFGMSEIEKFKNGKDQRFTGNDLWQTVVIDDDRSLSFCTGPCQYLVVACVEISDLEVGAVCQFRFQAVRDFPDDRPTEIAESYPIKEFLGTAGKTYDQIVWASNLGESTGTAKRRLRLFIAPPNGVTVTVANVTSTCLHD
jgi:hypothetical protein